MRQSIYTATSLLLAFAISQPALAADATPSPDIHFIWMGGNDCPPCVAWRNFELPKLQQSAEYKGIRFSYVIKAVGSPVPPRVFLPPEVAPLKDKLDHASGGRAGSPKGALVVNGEVYDFFTGTRTAEDIQSMIRSVQTGGPYPFKRCLKKTSFSRQCEIAA